MLQHLTILILHNVYYCFLSVIANNVIYGSSKNKIYLPCIERLFR